MLKKDSVDLFKFISDIFHFENTYFLNFYPSGSLHDQSNDCKSYSKHHWSLTRQIWGLMMHVKMEKRKIPFLGDNLIKEGDTKGINQKKYFSFADFLMNPAPWDSIYKFIAWIYIILCWIMLKKDSVDFFQFITYIYHFENIYFLSFHPSGSNHDQSNDGKPHSNHHWSLLR